jgi:non-lysosomal glucosylceramidase
MNANCKARDKSARTSTSFLSSCLLPLATHAFAWVPRLLLCVLPSIVSSQTIPAETWSRAIGDPFTTAMTAKEIIDDGPWQGLPLGGLGAGTISRTYRGDFARWHLDIGRHLYRSNAVDQFSLRVRSGEAGSVDSRVLSVYRPEDGSLSWWNWDVNVKPGNRYHALFPKAWFHYTDLPTPGLELTSEQFSPFLPGNYKESSYPVAVFRWKAINHGKEKLTVTLMFSWENTIGWWTSAVPTPNATGDDPPRYQPRWGASTGNINEYREEKTSAGMMKGLVQSRKGPAQVSEAWDGQMAMATMESPGVTVSYHARFSPTGDGGSVWNPMAIRGELTNQNDATPAAADERVASALAVTFVLAPGAERDIPFVLSWDLPIMAFGEEAFKPVKYYKRYTKFLGRSGRNGWAIAREGLLHGAEWSQQIDDWMRPYLAETRTPMWYKTALFNELSALVDNGTAWEDGRVDAGASTDFPPLGRFGYMECFDYAFYSTLDVEAYASFALAQLFPDLDKQEARIFASAVESEDLRQHPIGWIKENRPGKPESKPRKLRGVTPMDLGVPYESPWRVVANYAWQDTNTLKDESSNLVLKVWRDYVFTGKKDTAFLRETWLHLRATLAYMKKLDTDGDGLLDSGGIPDQTYDSWIMTGPSAYLGSLWMASLEAAVAIADVLGDKPAGAEYNGWLAAARKSYESKLWNGAYYDFDAGSKDRKAVMADQLFGQFYAQMTGLPDVVPREHRDSVLKTVYHLNVMGYHQGTRGAVNGIMSDGKPDEIDEHSNAFEVWTGVTYALAAFMHSSGMTEEAWKTAEGIYRTTYETGGMWFRTPEGWKEHDGKWGFRASMYMRPLAVWAIQAALRSR